jgi:hypothetical protein
MFCECYGWVRRAEWEAKGREEGIEGRPTEGEEKVKINQLNRYKSYKELSSPVKIRETDKRSD